MFETTKKYLTKKHKALAECLERQVGDMANVHGVPIEIGALNICRERVVGGVGKF